LDKVFFMKEELNAGDSCCNLLERFFNRGRGGKKKRNHAGMCKINEEGRGHVDLRSKG